MSMSDKVASYNSMANEEFMGSLDGFNQTRVLGSKRRVDNFWRSKERSVLKSGYYDAPMRVGDIWYNDGMEHFYKKYNQNDLGYEVGSISIVLANILCSNTRGVIMSYDTLKKNLDHHPDLKVDDYLLLDEIVGRSSFIAKDGDKTVAIVLQYNQLYHYALKSTKSGNGLFLTSFRRTNKISVDKIRKKHKEKKVKIIKDNLP
jgi:hypothetical protein